jgi:hypothetical protein
MEFCQWIFEKYTNIKFNENPSTGKRVVRCGQTDRRTDMTKLRVDFRNFENAPKMGQQQSASIDGMNKHRFPDQCVLCSVNTKSGSGFQLHQNRCYCCSLSIEYYFILMVEKGS